MQVAMASKRKRIDQTGGDGPTPERLMKAHGFVEIGGDERGGARITTMRDSPIERALARRVISPKQYVAAVKYRHHFHHAGLCPALASLDPDRVFATDVSSFSGMAKTDIQVFHRQRYRAAVSHIGPTSAQLVEQVVCAELSIEDAGYKLGWGSRPQAYAAAVERMKAALDELAKHWGL